MKLGRVLRHRGNMSLITERAIVVVVKRKGDSGGSTQVPLERKEDIGCVDSILDLGRKSAP